MAFEDALARLIQQKEKLDFLPVIKGVDFDAGGDVQIGDMTWDHESATLTVKYHNPQHPFGKLYEYYIDFEYYNVDFARDPQKRTGFAGFMDDLLQA